MAESSKFIGIGGIPDLFVSWVAAKLAMFELFTRGYVEDRACERGRRGRRRHAGGRDVVIVRS